MAAHIAEIHFSKKGCSFLNLPCLPPCAAARFHLSMFSIRNPHSAIYNFSYLPCNQLRLVQDGFGCQHLHVRRVAELAEYSFDDHFQFCLHAFLDCPVD